MSTALLLLTRGMSREPCWDSCGAGGGVRGTGQGPRASQEQGHEQGALMDSCGVILAAGAGARVRGRELVSSRGKRRGQVQLMRMGACARWPCGEQGQAAGAEGIGIRASSEMPYDGHRACCRGVWTRGGGMCGRDLPRHRCNRRATAAGCGGLDEGTCLRGHGSGGSYREHMFKRAWTQGGIVIPA